VSFVKHTGTESSIGSVGRRRLSYPSATRSAAHKKKAGSAWLPANHSILAFLDLDLDNLWLSFLGHGDGHGENTILERGLGLVTLGFHRQCD